MDAYRGVEFAAIAGSFARMIAASPVHRRHRIVAHQRLPGLAVLAGLGQIEPGLDVLSGWAGIVAGGKQINVDRASEPDRTGTLMVCQIDDRCHIPRLGAHILLAPNRF